MKLSRTPIAAALCCMALASAPYALAAGDTAGQTNRSDSSMTHGSAASAGSAGMSHSSSMSRDTVRQVQQALSDKGHNPGAVDGVMGPRTQAALKEYQKSQNLSGASGMDQQTLQSLGVQADASGSMGTAGRTGGSASSAGGMSGGMSGGAGGSASSAGGTSGGMSGGASGGADTGTSGGPAAGTSGTGAGGSGSGTGSSGSAGGGAGGR